MCKLFQSYNVCRYPKFVEDLQKEVTDLRLRKIEAQRVALALRKKMRE